MISNKNTYPIQILNKLLNRSLHSHILYIPYIQNNKMACPSTKIEEDPENVQQCNHLESLMRIYSENHLHLQKRRTYLSPYLCHHFWRQTHQRLPYE